MFHFRCISTSTSQRQTDNRRETVSTMSFTPCTAICFKIIFVNKLTMALIKYKTNYKLPTVRWYTIYFHVITHQYKCR